MNKNLPFQLRVLANKSASYDGKLYQAGQTVPVKNERELLKLARILPVAIVDDKGNGLDKDRALQELERKLTSQALGGPQKPAGATKPVPKPGPEAGKKPAGDSHTPHHRLDKPSDEFLAQLDHVTDEELVVQPGFTRTQLAALAAKIGLELDADIHVNSMRKLVIEAAGFLIDYRKRRAEEAKKSSAEPDAKQEEPKPNS